MNAAPAIPTDVIVQLAPAPGVAASCLSCGELFRVAACAVVFRVGAERIGLLCRACLDDDDRAAFDDACKRWEQVPR